MNPPTLREICESCKKYPYNRIFSKRLQARLDHGTVLAVLDALEWAHNAAPPQSGLRVICHDVFNRLNGKHP